MAAAWRAAMLARSIPCNPCSWLLSWELDVDLLEDLFVELKELKLLFPFELWLDEWLLVLRWFVDLLSGCRWVEAWVVLGRVKEGLLDLETVTSKPPLFDLEPELEEAGAGEEEEVREETVTLSRLAPSGRAAIFASNSCSCCNALTKAAFNLFVCSAFKAFLTLDVTHCSQITRTSFPGNKDIKIRKKLKYSALHRYH